MNNHETARLIAEATATQLKDQGLLAQGASVGIVEDIIHQNATSFLDTSSGGKLQGRVKKLMDKGFGFIEGNGGDIFFHHSCLNGVDFNDLHEGQSVEYEEGTGPKGPRAENISVA